MALGGATSTLDTSIELSLHSNFSFRDIFSKMSCVGTLLLTWKAVIPIAGLDIRASVGKTFIHCRVPAFIFTKKAGARNV